VTVFLPRRCREDASAPDQRGDRVSASMCTGMMSPCLVVIRASKILRLELDDRVRSVVSHRRMSRLHSAMLSYGTVQLETAMTRVAPSRRKAGGRATPAQGAYRPSSVPGTDPPGMVNSNPGADRTMRYETGPPGGATGPGAGTVTRIALVRGPSRRLEVDGVAEVARRGLRFWCWTGPREEHAGRSSQVQRREHG
jgi:hypothetical protein